MAGIDNDVIFGLNADFSNANSGTGASTSGELLTDGQMWIGSTVANAGGTHINVGKIKSTSGTINVTYSSPDINIDLAGGSVAVEHLTGNTGGQLNPDGSNNFNITGTGSITVAGSGSTLTPQLTGLTNHAILVGAGTATITNVGPSATAGQVLQSGGALADPSYSTPTYPSASGTAGKVLVSDGTNNIYSTPTFPNASATSGKFIQSDGTNWVASTPTLPTTAGTSGKVLQSNGTNYVESTPTYPSASGSAGKILRSDGTNNIYSTATYPDTAGTSGNVLTSDGTNWTSAAPPSTFSPNSTIQIFDDFIGAGNSPTTGMTTYLWSNYCWFNSSNTSALPAANTTENGHPGILQYTSGSGNTSYAIMLGNNNGSKVQNFILGGGILSITWVFKIATLSNGTNRYTLSIGIGDTGTSEDQVNGLYIKYSDNLNSGNWSYISANASTRTTNNTSTAATAAWHTVTITINAAASSVSYVLDGVSMGTAITTNIPTAAITPYFLIHPSVGTTATGSVLIDLFYLTQTLTSPR